MKEVTNKSIKMFTNVLYKYINKAEKIRDYTELEDITTDMVEELRIESLFSMVNGLNYFIIQTAKELKNHDKDCKDIELTRDRMIWIVNDVYDNNFDYHAFKIDVKSAMLYTHEHFEEENMPRKEHE